MTLFSQMLLSRLQPWCSAAGFGEANDYEGHLRLRCNGALIDPKALQALTVTSRHTMREGDPRYMARTHVEYLQTYYAQHYHTRWAPSYLEN